MANGTDRYRSRKNRARVNEILRRDWDPIGVGAESEDEYESYAATVYVMIMDRRASPEDVATYLFDIEARHMGLSRPNWDRAKRVAEKLVGMLPQFEAETNDP